MEVNASFQLLGENMNCVFVICVALITPGQFDSGMNAATRQRYIEQRVDHFHRAMDRIGLPRDFMPREKTNSSDPLFLAAALAVLRNTVSDPSKEGAILKLGSFGGLVVVGDKFVIDGNSSPDRTDPDEEALLLALWGKDHLHLGNPPGTAKSPAASPPAIRRQFITKDGELDFPAIAKSLSTRVKLKHGMDARAMPLLSESSVENDPLNTPDSPFYVPPEKGVSVVTAWIQSPVTAKDWMKKRMAWRIAYDVILEEGKSERHTFALKRSSRGPRRLALATRIELCYAATAPDSFQNIPDNQLAICSTPIIAEDYLMLARRERVEFQYFPNEHRDFLFGGSSQGRYVSADAPWKHFSWNKWVAEVHRDLQRSLASDLNLETPEAAPMNTAIAEKADRTVQKPNRSRFGMTFHVCKEGIHVDSVTAGEPASQCADDRGNPITLEPGDHIISVNGEQPTSQDNFLNLLASSDQKMTFIIKDSRTGQHRRLTTQLAW